MGLNKIGWMCICGAVARISSAFADDVPGRTWAAIWGTTNYDFSSGVHIGGDGAIYVYGQTRGSLPGQTNHGNYDFCLSKFNARGQEQWTRIWGSSNRDNALGAAADEAGNVVVAGAAGGSFDGQPFAGGASDFCLSFFNAAGDRLGTRIWGSTNADYAYGLAGATNGALFVSGQTAGNFGAQTNHGATDFYLCRLTPAGDVVWERVWGSHEAQVGGYLCKDRHGSLYVSGFTFGGIGDEPAVGGADACLTKFDQDGARQWLRIWGSTNLDNAYGVGAGNADMVYVGGYTRGDFDGQTNNAGSDDLFITCFTNDGGRAWSRIWGSAGTQQTIGQNVGVDEAESIYLCGFTWGGFDGQLAIGNYDPCLTKHDAHGNRLWTRIWGSEMEDGVQGLAIDEAGLAFIVGYAGGPFDGQTNIMPEITSYDFFASRYDPQAAAGLDGLSLQGASATLQWAGACGCHFEVAGATGMDDEAAWTVFPGLTNLAGRLSMVVTSPVPDEAAYYYRVQTRP